MEWNARALARANIYKPREGRVRQAREKLPAFEFRMVVDDEKPVDRVEGPGGGPRSAATSALLHADNW